MNAFLKSQTNFAHRPGNSWLSAPTLQRKCACGQHTSAGGECEECKKKRMQGIALHESVSSAERFGVQRFAHGKFVHDFSGLRAHTAVLFEEVRRGQTAPDGEAGSLTNEPDTGIAEPMDNAQPSAGVQTGETSCDTDTGKATARTLNKNECTKDCSTAHENKHVEDISECCAKAHVAKQKVESEEEKNKVHDQMKEWVDLNRPYLECRGFGESLKCAEKKYAALKCETASPRPKCCTPLVWYIRSATMKQKENCPNAGQSLTPCPFASQK